MKYALLVQEETAEKSVEKYIKPLVFENFESDSQVILLNDNVKKVIELWRKDVSVEDFFKMMDEQGELFNEIESFYYDNFGLSLFNYKAVE